MNWRRAERWAAPVLAKTRFFGVRIIKIGQVNGKPRMQNVGPDGRRGWAAIVACLAAVLVALTAGVSAPTISADQSPRQLAVGWRASDGPRRDSRDSPYVPSGYKRRVSAEFNDGEEVFDAAHNPLFITENRRLHGTDDLNVTRRLAKNGELELYTDAAFAYEGKEVAINPFVVSDGSLKIVAKPLPQPLRALFSPLVAPSDAAPEGAPPIEYSSGMLSTETERRHEQGYVQMRGYWELRAKMPRGRGLWSAFWLVGQTHQHWHEIDVVEVLGQTPERVYQNFYRSDHPNEPQTYYSGVDSTDGFHVYGLQITDDAVRYTVDGVETRHEAAHLDDEFYAIINLAVGGKWPGSPDGSTSFPAVMEVDYLRIYAAP
jgi:hypothetical protein